jgi:tetratricopeptide (TPR) repeat protein
MNAASTCARAMAAHDRQRAAGDRSDRALLDALAGAAAADWMACAQALMLRGEPESAAAVLAAAAWAHPASREIRFALAGSLQHGGDVGQAEALLRGLLTEAPDHTGAAFLLARLLKEQGRMQAMAVVLRDLFRHPPHDLEDLIRAVELLDDAGRKMDAAALCEAEIAAGCSDPRVHAYAGMLLSQLGRFALARERRLFALAHSGQALEWEIPLGLAEQQRYADSGHPDFALFRDALQRPGLSASVRASLLFAAGKAHDDIGDHAQAATYLREANALRHALARWPRKQWRRSIEARLRRVLPAERLSATEWTPVFIVGMPRSGTTLLAGLLSRHPQVCHRGELPWMPALADEVLAISDGDYGARLARAAATYAARLRQDDSNAHWFIDKQPHNFLNVDVILAMFPQARILHCERNAADIALSLWMQSFQPGNQDYAYDMGDIAAAIGGCRRLMAHWHARYPDAIHTVRYESLAADPATVLTEVSAWLGLPAGDLPAGNLDDATGGEMQAIGTASLWQARQPVHTRSVERWRRYADYLPELAKLADG